MIKYPPIQGGVSAQGYWIARGLARRGHTVHVVTNALEVEESHCIRLTDEDHPWLTPSFPGGGRVYLHTPEVFSPKLTHIPQANPFVSKLAGLAARVVVEHDAQLLFSYYMEPNGVAASLAAGWTERPYVVQHAGSDLGRLMKQPGLDTTYHEILRRADGVCTGAPYALLGMGVTPESLYRHPPFYLPQRYFSPEAEPLELNAHIEEVEAGHPEGVHNPGPLDPTLPTIGVYGKLGEVKGSFDLLAALGKLKRGGKRFNFVAVTNGRERPRYLEMLKREGLEACSWVLPFMAHWRIPGFIRSCDAVCFLERDFPIAFHAPTIPREILACGTCLILSGEILAKQPYRDRMVDRENFLLTEDPKNHAALAAILARVIDNPQETLEIGMRGHATLPEALDSDLQAEGYEQMFLDVIERAARRPSHLSPSQRGLAEDRTGALRRLAAPLVAVLGNKADAALARHLAAQPTPLSPAQADADAFCAACSRSAGGSERDHDGKRLRIREAARYTQHLLWMSWLNSDSRTQRASRKTEGAGNGQPSPRFAQPDRLPELAGGRWQREVVQTLAPLTSRWLRIDRFTTTPWSITGDTSQPSDDAETNAGTRVADSLPDAPHAANEQILVFHKLPSLTGHHFRVNRFTAGLLEACDGRRSVAQLVQRYRDSTGTPPEKVAATVGAALRRFYREGLIVFVEPSAG